MWMMSEIFAKTKVVCFDLGNTLIEFGPRQVAVLYEALKDSLEGEFGTCDVVKLKEVRDRQIVAPYHNGYVENDLHECCRELIEEIYPVTASAAQVEALAEVRYRSFVEAIELAEGVSTLLSRLGERYRLALLSNYPCGRSIRDGMEKLGMTGHFESIVVSGEVGFVKPHRRPYELMIEQLGAEAGECVYVGDNWLADVQGAKGMGMGAILTTQHLPYERFDPKEGDHEPDARIGELGELEGLLLG